MPAIGRPVRAAKIRAQLGMLRGNRRGPNKDVVIRTPAGGTLTRLQVEDWINPRTISSGGRVVEVYLQQVCHYINETRGLVGHMAAPGALRAMLSVPQDFYAEIRARAGEAATGSQRLRAAGISAVEFRQLEYFFMPVEFALHSNLVVVSPRNRTVELLDSNPRGTRTLLAVFETVVRFLIHELSALHGPGPWTFMHGEAPLQETNANCANFTCLFAKRLACAQPLGQMTDVGQGPNYEDETRMCLQVIGDLFLQSGWSAHRFPIGGHASADRHDPRGNVNCQPQHRLLLNHPFVSEDTSRGIQLLSSRTGKFDRFATKEDLTAWCVAQPPLGDRKGNAFDRMQGHSAWARGTREQFISMVEMRERDILNGTFPREDLATGVSCSVVGRFMF